MVEENPWTRGERLAREAGYSREDAAPRSELKLKRGGSAGGKRAEVRPDKRARGGKVGPVKIVVQQRDQAGDAAKQQVAAHAGMQRGLQAGMALGAKAAAPAGPPGPMRPPMAGGPPPGPAPAPMPAMRPPGVKNGGMIEVKAHKRRRAGGPV